MPVERNVLLVVSLIRVRGTISPKKCNIRFQQLTTPLRTDGNIITAFNKTSIREGLSHLSFARKSTSKICKKVLLLKSIKLTNKWHA